MDLVSGCRHQKESGQKTLEKEWCNGQKKLAGARAYLAFKPISEISTN